MILFVDPDPKRAVLAFQRMNEEDRENTIWAKTYLEAQTTIYNYRNELTSIHLEHDLNGRSHMNTASEESGMEIVRYLERLAKHNYQAFEPLLHVHFVIHTWNSHAGALMVERLRNLGLGVEWIPFGTEKK